MIALHFKGKSRQQIFIEGLKMPMILLGKKCQTERVLNDEVLIKKSNHKLMKSKSGKSGNIS